MIYAFADAALVVTSDFEKGGTWTGAIEQLDHPAVCSRLRPQWRERWPGHFCADAARCASVARSAKRRRVGEGTCRRGRRFRKKTQAGYLFAVSARRIVSYSRPAVRAAAKAWVEPFCGSAVVAFNVQPKKALLCDSNVHIIQFYRDLQASHLTPGTVRAFLFEHGDELRRRGEDYYYAMRDRFNQSPDSLTFLFLNRSCFNGVMRFNRSGKFNVPYCHKPERFAPAYVTKIANQVRRIGEVLVQCDWTFEVADFRETLRNLASADFVYADPPYLGRHVDYYNSWSESDDADLAELLRMSPAKFIVSTWHSKRI